MRFTRSSNQSISAEWADDAATLGLALFYGGLLSLTD